MRRILASFVLVVLACAPAIDVSAASLHAPAGDEPTAERETHVGSLDRLTAGSSSRSVPPAAGRVLAAPAPRLELHRSALTASHQSALSFARPVAMSPLRARYRGARPRDPDLP